MLQRFLHNTRINVFENAGFYYWLLWVLVGYSITREFVQKFSFIYHVEPFVFPREIIGFLFFGFAFCSIISAWILRKRIDKNILFFVAALSIISLINEVRFAFEIGEYSLKESLSTGQLYYTFKIVFPFLFLGFWPILDVKKIKTNAFINTIEKLFLANAFLIIVFGVFFGIPILESYPVSGRWGYNGLLLDRVITQLIYGILLLHRWRLKNPFDWKSVIYIICLLLSGQKAGFLWVGLFIMIVVIRRPFWRTTILCLYISFIALFPYVVKLITPFSIFWKDIYEDSGPWTIFFSTRNNTIQKIWENNKNDIDFIDFIIGGVVRFPSDIEMLPFDLILYFGIVGVIGCCWFLVKWVSSWKWAIPLIISCFAGGFFGSFSMPIFYGLFLYSSLIVDNKP